MGTWMAKVKGAQPSAFPSAVVRGGPDISWRRRSQGLASRGAPGAVRAGNGQSSGSASRADGRRGAGRWGPALSAGWGERAAPTAPDLPALLCHITGRPRQTWSGSRSSCRTAGLRCATWSAVFTARRGPRWQTTRTSPWCPTKTGCRSSWTGTRVPALRPFLASADMGEAGRWGSSGSLAGQALWVRFQTHSDETLTAMSRK